jgi:hypothetical protein
MKTVRVRELPSTKVPIGLQRATFGCFDDDEGTGNHVWIIPDPVAPGAKRYYVVVDDKDNSVDFEHDGQPSDLIGIVLIDETTREVVSS